MTFLEFWQDCLGRYKDEFEYHQATLDRLWRSLDPLAEQLAMQQRQFVSEAHVKLMHAEKMVEFFKREGRLGR